MTVSVISSSYTGSLSGTLTGQFDNAGFINMTDLSFNKLGRDVSMFSYENCMIHSNKGATLGAITFSWMGVSVMACRPLQFSFIGT